jgi:hypothetical protein
VLRQEDVDVAVSIDKDAVNEKDDGEDDEESAGHKGPAMRWVCDIAEVDDGLSLEDRMRAISLYDVDDEAALDTGNADCDSFKLYTDMCSLTDRQFVAILAEHKPEITPSCRNLTGTQNPHFVYVESMLSGINSVKELTANGFKTVWSKAMAYRESNDLSRERASLEFVDIGAGM